MHFNIKQTKEKMLMPCLDALKHVVTSRVLHLGTDQARIAMEEVHEGICGTHQSTPKMKWLLRRAGFYWPTMMTDCFRYYKDVKSAKGLEIFS
jgi:hypothetical protein